MPDVIRLVPERKSAFPNGFSLLELSIGVVIIALLIGGILTGRSMIRAAEIRVVQTELQQYEIAIATFSDKYAALPGDMTDATEFWGESAAHCNTGAFDSVPGTCNGDGDGWVEYDSPNNPSEVFMFWNHLAYAGLIKGTYTGITGSDAPWDIIYGENIPSSKMEGAGYTVMPEDLSGGGNPAHLAYNFKNSIAFGQITSSREWPTEGLTPEEALLIDVKTDDGHPATGKIVTSGYLGGCVIPNTGILESSNFDIRYDLSEKSPVCGLIMKNLF